MVLGSDLGKMYGFDLLDSVSEFLSEAMGLRKHSQSDSVSSESLDYSPCFPALKAFFLHGPSPGHF